MYIYIKTKSHTLELDRPQHTHPVTCAIAQQYSSITFVSLPSNSHQKKKKIFPSEFDFT